MRSLLLSFAFFVQDLGEWLIEHGFNFECRVVGVQPLYIKNDRWPRY